MSKARMALNEGTSEDREITRSRLNVFASKLGIKITDRGVKEPGDHGYRLTDEKPKRYNLTIDCHTLEEVAYVLRGISIGLKLACRHIEATMIDTEHIARDLENDINRIV